MNHQEQPNESQSSNTVDFGMNPDDLSALNQVLQQVKGISGVSSPAYEIIDTSYSNDV